MTGLFLKLLNMSISAGWLVLAVLVLRLPLRRAPRWIHVVLWGIVGLRLICPVSIPSPLSLIPSAQTVSPTILTDPVPMVTTGIPPLNSAVNPILSATLTPAPGDSANPLQIWAVLATVLWCCGMAAMLAYTLFSYLRLGRRLSGAMLLNENIYLCHAVASPFVLGIVRPKIYLPPGLDDPSRSYVIAHERAHIHRRDPLWKLLGFLLLTLHWYNPLMWLAYSLLCRDIELACDQRVIRELDSAARADYSQALVDCAVNRRRVTACPLAFGEVGVKQRLQSILRYRKSGFWIILFGVLVCVAVAVCFLTDPADSRRFPIALDNVSNLEPGQIVERIRKAEGTEDTVYVSGENVTLTVKGDFSLVREQTLSYYFYREHTPYAAGLQISPGDNRATLTDPELCPEPDRRYLLEIFLNAVKYIPQAPVSRLAPAEGYRITLVPEGTPSDYARVITYDGHGVGDIDGWYIHLRLEPLGSGGEPVELFFSDSAASRVVTWFDYWEEPASVDAAWELSLDAYPGVYFRCEDNQIIASGTIAGSSFTGHTILVSGMPIWNAFFTDLTGDGYPELCATVSFGSGIVDTHVVVVDCRNGQEYTLWERGSFDYILRLENDTLYCEKLEYPFETASPVETGLLMLVHAGGGEGSRLIIAPAEAGEKP